MRRAMILVLGAWYITASAQAALARPSALMMSDFAHGAEIASSESELRSFTLIPVIMKDVQRRDLGDVRVYDGNNEQVPALIMKTNGQNKVSKQKLSVSPVRSAGKTSGYIIDRTASHDRSLKALYLQWNKWAAPRVLSMRIEHGDDRKNWDLLADSETVVNFNFEGIALNQNIIDINNYTKRFLKLTFLDTGDAPALASVTAYTSNRKLADYWWMPAGKLQAQPGKQESYRFSINKGVRPELLKLSFPSLNTILAGSLHIVETVNGSPQRKQVLKNLVSFVVTLNNKVVKSRPVDISRWPATDWQITVSASRNINPEDLPSVMLAYPRYEVIFASDGAEPYTAVWGNAAAGAPVDNGITQRIKAGLGAGKNIEEVTTGIILDNARLTALMESRQTPWLAILAGLLTLGTATALYKLVFRR